jgi:Ca-activated chloride channel family protein
VNLSRWVQVRQVYGKQPTYGNRTADVPLEEMERGGAQSALIEMELGNRPAGQYRVAKVELSYDDSTTKTRERIVKDVIYDFVTDRALVQANVNPVVQREIELALASRNLERTVMGMRTQQISPTMAIQELERTRSLLVQQGKTMQIQNIDQAINDIRGGASAEKTLVGTILNLDRGREK